KAEREMIAVAVSSQNHCHYCLTAHGAGLRQLTGNPQLAEEIAMNYRIADVTPRQRAMLDFVVKMTNEPDAVGEADRQSLRDAGFDDRTIFDIASLAGFYNMTNRVSTATGMKPNPEYHAMAR
ncbi:MAG: peroxidase-related enzyme, partial [Rhodocyclaceae bacterium]|nr:peroxidase-related enzyme [Rhodocyclaceae bacterium]